MRGVIEPLAAFALTVAVIAGGLRLLRREWRRWQEFGEPELDEQAAEENVRPHGNVLTLPKREDGR